jgi:predicted hotdog family 3-hydroxylacyl-ACP dehydratase
VSGAALDRAWLQSHLPHRGAMNLLDAIVAWDPTFVHARSTSHRSAGNPLRRAGELPIACGIEYAAQAVAAHGALLSGGVQPAAAGFLAGVRSVQFHAHRLDDIEAPLEIRAEQLGGGASGVLYAFSVGAADMLLLEGRLTIVLDASMLPTGAR